MKQSELAAKASKFFDFETTQKHTWCSGCGNYGILNAVSRALVLQGYSPRDVMWANDVGCNGNVSDKIMTNTIHGLHGRVLPLAAGLHLGNTDMPVIAMAGDGSTLSEGINHLVHSIRNNYNITFILHNNKNYGLTTGQASSTTPQGYNMNATYGETYADTLNPLQLALSLNCGFAARGYSGDVNQLTDLVIQAIDYKGFSIVEVLQLCPTYNKATPEDWYLNRVYDVSEKKDFDNTDIWQSRRIVDDYEGKDRIATGVLHINNNRQDFYSMQINRENIESTLVSEVKHQDISKLCLNLV